MSEASREQLPLLCEDLSEEEQFPEYPRRYRPMVYRGRVKNQIKGAATIITRWPDHWSSTLTYWWIGVTMVAITIFIAYNTFIAFVLLPQAHMKPINPRTNKEIDGHNLPSHLPDVYMHIFANSAEEVDINKYLPNIEIISDKHLDFNFNLIVVYNDTLNDSNTLSEEENNDIAFNSLWDKKHFYSRNMSGRKNINVKYVVLSHIMDESPLKKSWRLIPPQFVGFLVKAISVWDKGGIAINPTILTPRSSSIYVEKIQDILKNYKCPTKSKLNENANKKYPIKHKNKLKKKVNNIRDIIDILEHEDSLSFTQDNLTEAEDKNDIYIAPSGRKLMAAGIENTNNKTKYDISMDQSDFKNNSIPEDKIHNKTGHKTHDSEDNLVNVDDDVNSTAKAKHTKMNLLPLFLEYLFHDKSTKTDNKPITVDEEGDSLNRSRKNIIPANKEEKLIQPSSSNKTDIKINDNLRPLIISAKGILPDEISKNNNGLITPKSNYDHELTIDLKGNVLATRIPCHAFIGTMFSNVVHHSAEETLRDFIIAELSLFCKGLLSSCPGIDVILI